MLFDAKGVDAKGEPPMIVIDRVACRTLGLSPKSIVNLAPERSAPFWEKLGLVYVPTPGAALLTSKDRADLDAALQAGADWIALSFVQRPDDVIVLADHFLSAQAELYGEQPKRLSDDAVATLRRYAWPGNVRELANVIEHAHVLAGQNLIEAGDLPERLRSIDEDGRTDPASDLCLADIERRAIAEALRRTNNKKFAACRLLGINIQRLNRKISKLGIRGR